MTFQAKWEKAQAKIAAKEALVRAKWLNTEEAGEAAWEMGNDRAWEHAHEYAPEVYDEMVRDDMMGRS